MASQVNLVKGAVLVELSSGNCSNLKAALKYINQVVTSQVLEDDEGTCLDGNKVHCNNDVDEDFTDHL